MNKGIEILLERMKSNPEEFVPKDSYSPPTKWGHIIQQYNEYLTTEENETIQKAYKETITNVMRERLTQAVMKELLDPKMELPIPTHIGQKSATGLGGQTLGQLSNAGLTLTTLGGSQQPTWVSNGTGQTQLQANTLQLGQTQLQEQELQHMKAHLEYLKIQQEQAKAQQASNRQTLVGKLYNYLGSNK